MVQGEFNVNIGKVGNSTMILVTNQLRFALGAKHGDVCKARVTKEGVFIERPKQVKKPTSQ